MTAEPKKEGFEEDVEDFDEFDEEENERGLSGLVVLLMGLVMLGAFVSVVWIAYQQGIRSGAQVATATPTIAADPDPVKIENSAAEGAKPANEQSVYDTLDGTPEPTETIAAAPEEPIERPAEAPALAVAEATDPGVVDDAVADRIASLAEADQALESTEEATAAAPAPAAPASTPAASVPAAATAASAPTTSPGGTHMVQVGAFKSQAEAEGQWALLQRKLGDYAAGRATDIERADLGEKGVYFRLRVGPFRSKTEAQTYCEGLKSRGADCMVKAK
jgi:cell division protein FtsN